LLSIDRGRFFFYSDGSQVSDQQPQGVEVDNAEQSGIKGWLQGRLTKIETAWKQAESGVAFWLRRVWDWLHSWTRPDERMLVRLWWARKIELHHGGSRSGDEVGSIWQDYLSRQWKRHLIWLSVNTVIAPFSLLLWILPGPNVIGYWFAYRAIHHFLVVCGISRVRRGVIPTELCPALALDVPVERDEEGKARHSALDGPTALLEAHVAWSETSQRRPASGRRGARHSETRTERP
jgi:hypothetical protein